MRACARSLSGFNDMAIMVAETMTDVFETQSPVIHAEVADLLATSGRSSVLHF